MSKTDDVLLALSRTIPKYLSELGSFQYNGKNYLLIDNFVSSHNMKCGVCGNYPIIDVSVIRNEDTGRLNACHTCINRITNQKVSMWFETFRKKRENIMENRKYIDGLSSILVAYDRNELSFKMSNEVVEKLRKMFVQMCDGLNPGTDLKQLAEANIVYKVEI